MLNHTAASCSEIFRQLQRVEADWACSGMIGSNTGCYWMM